MNKLPKNKKPHIKTLLTPLISKSDSTNSTKIEAFAHAQFKN